LLIADCPLLSAYCLLLTAYRSLLLRKGPHTNKEGGIVMGVKPRATEDADYLENERVI
jgi:hypothetical protein